eukprot:COSAG06_NODE_6927_length_2712_cov_3.797168_3_plen_108_part_00
MRCAVLCCAVLRCAVLGWAGLGWAGLCWAGLGSAGCVFVTTEQKGELGGYLERMRALTAEGPLNSFSKDFQCAVTACMAAWLLPDAAAWLLCSGLPLWRARLDRPLR